MKTKKEIAEETLQIIDDGFYFKESVKIDVREVIKNSVEKTITISPEDWRNIQESKQSEKHQTEISVKSCSTIEAIIGESGELKTAVLNFASAKNPGGGFLGGASAQEESLARSSGLFATLSKDLSMYEYNRNRKTFLYSDFMIYSPDVPFWFNDKGDLLPNNQIINVITSPAPNKGAMVQHNRTDELTELNRVLEERFDKILMLALSQKVESLILGAWGCGVFRNNPEDVSAIFKKVISEKYPTAFKRIVFAIYDSSKEKLVLKAFEKQFNKIVS